MNQPPAPAPHGRRPALGHPLKPVRHPKPADPVRAARARSRTLYILPFVFGMLTMGFLTACMIAVLFDAQMDSFLEMAWFGPVLAGVGGALWVVWAVSNAVLYYKDDARRKATSFYGYCCIFGAMGYAGVILLVFSAAFIRWSLRYDFDRFRSVYQMAQHPDGLTELYSAEAAFVSFLPFTGAIGLLFCVYSSYESIRENGLIPRLEGTAVAKRL